MTTVFFFFCLITAGIIIINNIVIIGINIRLTIFLSLFLYITLILQSLFSPFIAVPHLFVQTDDCFFVDVIRRHDGELGEPRQVEFVCDLVKDVPRCVTEIREIAAVDPDADRCVAQIVQRQCHGAEVQQAAPEKANRRRSFSLTSSGSPDESEVVMNEVTFQRRRDSIDTETSGGSFFF